MMPGMIMLWYGSVATIPSGWGLCDGTLNTPDLRLKFVYGYGPPLSPGDTGGASAHTHDFTGDGHAHDLNAGNDIGGLAPAGDHDHHTSTDPTTGTTNQGTNLPPYRVLCYIMKLPIP